MARKRAKSARSAFFMTRSRRRWPPTALRPMPRAGSRASCARSREVNMAHSIRFHQTGGPDVLRLEEVAVGNPGPGQVRLRHAAVGLNFADTYFRSGMYPVQLPAGMGVEASGGVEAIGDDVTNVAVGDRVTYTGFLNTLGAYSTERLIPAAPLIKLPEAIGCETAAAMTMRGLTSAYLLRRIWTLRSGDTILLHAAA